MDDVPGRPDGLPARFQWTGERISAVDHRGQADVYKLVNRLDAQGFVIKMYKATDRADFRRRVHNEIIAIRRLNQQSKFSTI